MLIAHALAEKDMRSHVLEAQDGRYLDRAAPHHLLSGSIENSDRVTRVERAKLNEIELAPVGGNGSAHGEPHFRLFVRNHFLTHAEDDPDKDDREHKPHRARRDQEQAGLMAGLAASPGHIRFLEQYG